MRFLFVAYCFGPDHGQSMIGVYKRGLRVAMEVCERGHEVCFYCTGRENYQDDLTRAAEERIRFVDLEFDEFGEPEEVRATMRRGIAELRPDVVVVGESPLDGPMLEATLCACELRVPVVFLDNAYGRPAVYMFRLRHGAMADGIVLTGTSSQHAHLPRLPDWICQVPPYIESAPEQARRVLDDLGLRGERLVTMLGYDQKVARLGRSLIEKLDAMPEHARNEYLILSREPDEAPDAVPESLRGRLRMIAIPRDPVLFGLLQLSSLAIVKYGNMQVTECLALQTPVVAIFHAGLHSWTEALPRHLSRCLCVVDDADDRAVEGATRLLRVTPEEMAAIHDGQLGATVKAAEFLERLPRTPRRGTWDDAVWLGFREERVRPALARELGRDSFDLDVMRATVVREKGALQMYSLLCGCRVDGEERFVRLWGRQFATVEAAERDLAEAEGTDRRVLFASPADRILIEADLGQARLPELMDC